ncbi:fer-1-like protein 4 [Pseudochaenichthys georgianus]|uniref:fer-1-like protein 4 n=1 Tax=Pseudochaenichthys georgianus TaxID=52239 RepID=UPI00146C4982|nr:fer-1-like protein 4 [Pseudochaenichthys georgianus]
MFVEVGKPLPVCPQHFRWPHYGKEIRDDVLSISVYNCSKVFSNRLLGKLVISLQHVVSTGRVLLREPLTDSNYSLTEIYIELDIRYHPVEGTAGSWEGLDFIKVEDQDESALVFRNVGFTDPESQLTVARPGPLEREARLLGRSLVRTGNEDEDDDEDDFDDDIMDLDASDIIFTPLLSRCRPMSRNVAAATPRVQGFQVNVNILEAQKLVGVNINPAVFIRVGDQKKHTATQKSTNCPFYNENFQFEFQETPQVLFDKVIEIKVFHRRTLAFLMTHIGTFKIDISTVYNQPDHRFYQKWAPLTDPADTRSGIKGYVKASLSVLMKGDALSMASLPAPSSSSASDDIEKNLLLPRGMASERPWARFRVRIYRAEGLPTMEAGLMAKMSKATDRTVFIDPYVQVTFAGQQGETSVASATSSPVWNEEISFIEQFPPLAQRIRVQVLDDAKMGDIALATHFLDLQQISDPTRNGFNPTFGPCWVNLYGSPQNSTLGDVHQALNQGWGDGIFYRGRILLALSVEVYTSPAAIAPDKPSAALGKVKGAFGKMGLRKKSKTEKNKQVASSSGLVEESGDAGVEVPEAVTVEVEETHPLPEGFLGRTEEFLLFASLFEVTMMDPSVGTRPMTFELSIGNYGKVLGVGKSKKSQSREELRRSREDLNEEAQGLLESEDELDREDLLSPESENRSVTAPARPQPTEYDRSFQCLPLQPPSEKQKPCLFVWSQFEDHSFRLYQANWLNKTADRLEIGLDGVERLLRRPRSNAKGRLVEVLLELVASCKQFSVFSDRRSQSRPNNLDRCRKDFIKKHLVLVARQAVRARRRVTRRMAKQHLMESRKLLRKLRLLAKEPQTTIPDAFLWLLSGSKRLAYVRIPAYSILFSLVEEQRGRDCGKVITLYMKSPDGSASEIFAKLEVFMWLGLAKYSKETTNCLPEEFLPIYKEEDEEQRSLVPAGRMKLPVSLSCQDSRYFQLRCHMYQGRGLIAADDNGLSDPFAKVLFSTQCQVTRVLNETISPAWCESLLFDRVLLEGTREELEQDPPLITINIYDQDAMGSPKPLGRAFAEPEFKTVEQYYKKPHLRFFDISMGRAPAGELLAAFELIELDYSSFGEPCIPSSVDPQELTYLQEQRYYNIPEGVRPVLKTFRIEAAKREEEEMEEHVENEAGNLTMANIEEEEEEDMVVVEIEPPKRKNIATLKLYAGDLESDFSQFQDWLQIFPLYKGRANIEGDEEDEEERLMGKYKGSFLVYPIDSGDEEDTKCQITNGIPKNSPIKVLVRVYIVKATTLAPTDPNGKADPYLVVRAGKQSLDTVDRYIPKQLNPTFGEVFELTVSFPLETELVITVMDHDLIGADDMIGETRVDLENRFYSRHRPSCGLALYYDTDGYNVWRDAKRPSAILAELCNKNGILSPEYRTSEVKVLNKIFKIPSDAIPEGLLKKNQRSPEEEAEIEEHVALSVLQRWGEMNEFLPGAVPLVPEHVEIRSLLSQDKPGLPQGYLHMWVDMFPNDVPAPPPVDIKPRLPEQYELRVIIWNTDDVFLDDVNPFTGIPSSDIYVKGWIKGLDGEKQETDVHFSSLTGEGNFNWRFVFRFDYLPTEKEVVFKKKESFFSLEASEFRQPAVLTLQVWDYDRIAANDFLGSIELRLNDMVRAAKSSTKCKIALAKDRASPRFSIFRAKKMKGWWPLIRQKTAEDFEREEKEKEEAKKKGKKKKKDKRSAMRQEDIQFTDSSGSTFLLMGKVEAELQLVTLEQAEANPVGRARKEPEPLDKPNRPSTTFTWFVNPMKTFIFLIWKKFKKFIIALVILAILTLFLGLIVYTLPQQIASIIIKG